MRWLITGGCGFIGTNLISYLLAQGEEHIRVVDNLSVGTRASLGSVCNFREISLVDGAPSGVELLVEDIMNTDAAQSAGMGIDVVVHLAANTGVAPSVEDPMSDCKANVIGTLNYLESARLNGIGRFIFASSGAPAGEVTPPIHEEIVPKPVSPYGASKLAGEGYCSSYFRCFGIHTVALRFGNVYGPGSLHKGSVVAKFINMAFAGEKVEIYGDGAQTRDFIFIDDLIEAIRLSSEKADIGGEVFQIATSRETSVSELAKTLFLVMNEESIPTPEIIYSAKRNGDVMRNFSDTSKALRRLEWEAQMSLKDGLRKTVQYFSKELENHE